MTSDTHSVTREREIAAPIDQVWTALTDYHQFGTWFGVALDQPFAVNQPSTGTMTVPGAEGLPWLAQVVEISPPRRFAFRWHLYDPESNRPLNQQPLTLVTFDLEATGQHTKVTVTESGFDILAADRRADVMRGNASGWDIQTDNLAQYVES